MKFRVQVEVEKHTSQNSYYSAMQQGTCLHFYYAIADPKVGEKHISTKYSKCNSFKLQLIYSTLRTCE